LLACRIQDPFLNSGRVTYQSMMKDAADVNLVFLKEN
jgi:hypothetical protein